MKRILFGSSNLTTPDALKIASELLWGSVIVSWEKLYECDPKPMVYITSIVVEDCELKSMEEGEQVGETLMARSFSLS